MAKYQDQEVDALPSSASGDYFKFDRQKWKWCSGIDKGAISGGDKQDVQENVEKYIGRRMVGMQVGYLSQYRIDNPGELDPYVQPPQSVSVPQEKGFAFMSEAPLTMFVVAIFSKIDEKEDGVSYFSNPIYDQRFDIINIMMSKSEGGAKKYQHFSTGLLNELVDHQEMPTILGKMKKYPDRYILVYVPATDTIAEIKTTQTFEFGIVKSFIDHPSTTNKDWKKNRNSYFGMAPKDGDHVYSLVWDGGYHMVCNKEGEGIVPYTNGKSTMLSPSFQLRYHKDMSTDIHKKVIDLRRDFTDRIYKEQARIRATVDGNNGPKTIPSLIIEESDDRPSPANYANAAADRILGAANNQTRQEPATPGWPPVPPTTNPHNVGVMSAELPPPPPTEDLPF